nr:hypothetical protein HmN_000955900 [Hymenolepis microstoma]
MRFAVFTLQLTFLQSFKVVPIGATTPSDVLPTNLRKLIISNSALPFVSSSLSSPQSSPSSLFFISPFLPCLCQQQSS